MDRRRLNEQSDRRLGQEQGDGDQQDTGEF